jgi:pimeloyl-ACP methyl ester carboxylesterase
MRETVSVGQLVRDGVTLVHEEAGRGDPPLVFIHGLACHRGFWSAQVPYFAPAHRVLAVDLRGHGDSDAPEQPYTIAGLADDVAWTCGELGIERPAVIGHSLGGLVALEFAAAYPGQVRAAVLIDSVLLPAGDREHVVDELVAALHTARADRALRDYYAAFFGPHDDPATTAWIIEEVVRTPPHVTSSVWEESIRSWDDAEALRRCRAPLLYLDAGTPNADLARAASLAPQLVVGRTVGSGHFSPLEVPDQVNAMLARFLAVSLASAPRRP